MTAIDPFRGLDRSFILPDWGVADNLLWFADLDERAVSLHSTDGRGGRLYMSISQIDNQNSSIYNSATILLMGRLIEPTRVGEEPDSSRRTIAIAVAGVIIIAVVLAVLLRSQPRSSSGPPAYAARLKLSEFKMSAAENFVGATVSYVDGTVANSGDKTVTHVVVEVDFKDDIGQLAQREVIPLQALKTTGPYPESVDFSVAPLGPGLSTTFRLTFESISAQWNHQYPDIQVADVTVK
jgi:hypothetical protein